MPETLSVDTKKLEAAHAALLPDGNVEVTTVGGAPETDPLDPNYGKHYDAARVAVDAAVQFSGESEQITSQQKGGKNQWAPWDEPHRARRSASQANREIR